MIVGVALGLMIVVLAIGIWGAKRVCRFPPEAPVARAVRKNRWLRFGYVPYAIGCFLQRKFGIYEEERQNYEGWFVNEEPEVRQVEEGCRRGLMLLGVIGGLALVLLTSDVGGQFRDTSVSAIVRPDSGSEVRYLRARYQEETYELAIPVSEKRMSVEEVRAAWEDAKEKLPEWVLGENVDAEHVAEPLVFFERLPGTAISVQWLTSDYRLVDYEGKVHGEYASAEGSYVELTAMLSYGEWQEKQSVTVRVLPVEMATSDSGEALQEYLLDRAEEQAYSGNVHLPETWRGKEVEFFLKSRQSPWTYVLIAGMAAAIILLGAENRRKERRAQRERQLLRDYPDVVSKLTVLLEAGLTARRAWERLANDYLHAREHGGERRFVYEELVRSRNRLSAGNTEEQVYEEFGRRCGNIRYLRLSSMLAQNLKKGNGSMIPLLRKEAMEAFCDRKEQAKQLGEEAGTKLLMPMAGILVLILAIVMIPAFMAF